MVAFYSRWRRAIIGDIETLSKKLFIMVCLKNCKNHISVGPQFLTNYLTILDIKITFSLEIHSKKSCF